MHTNLPTVSMVPEGKRFQHLLTQFPELRRPAQPKEQLKHAVEHIIETTDQLVADKAKRLPPGKVSSVKTRIPVDDG